MIKDSIGKDITKMTVPVFLNDTSGILQRCAATMEYVELIDKAVYEKESLKRLALIGSYQITIWSSLVKAIKKPFNPLLGETYEIVHPMYKFLAE
jgi:hypothetical protein